MEGAGRWSKKVSVQSQNVSSLMSSAVNQSESGKQKLARDEEEVKAMRDQLKKNERRVQRIIQGGLIRQSETQRHVQTHLGEPKCEDQGTRGNGQAS